MTYITGTITDANPAAALYTPVATALTTEGYTLVDTVVIATRTHKVWLNAAAGNLAGKDWYLDVSYVTTGTGALAFVPFEGYNNTTHIATRGPFTSGTSVPDATYFSPYGAVGYALETNWNPIGNSAGSVLPITSYGYWISITRNRVIAMYSPEPTKIWYYGLYKPDPLHATQVGADSFPLVTLAGSTVSFTRVPRFTSSFNWAGTSLAAYLWVNSTPSIPASVTSGYPTVVHPFYLVAGNSGVGVQVSIWGSPYDLGVIPAALTVVRGDTLTVDGNPWVLMTAINASPPQTWLFRAL